MRCRNYKNNDVVFFNSNGIGSIETNYQEINLLDDPTISGTLSRQNFKVEGYNQVEKYINFYGAYGELLYKISTKELPLNILPTEPYIYNNYVCTWSKTVYEVNAMTDGGDVKCVVNYKLATGAKYCTTLIPFNGEFANGTIKLTLTLTASQASNKTVSITYPDGSVNYTISAGSTTLNITHTIPANQGKGNIRIYTDTDLSFYIGGNTSSSDTAPFLANDYTRESVQEIRLSPNMILGQYCLQGFSGLTTVNLEKIIIPEGIQYLGNRCLNGCQTIKTINLPNSMLFYSSGTTPTVGALAGSALENVIIGDTATQLGTSTFYGCDKLTTVVFGEGLTTIGSELFYGCTALENVQLNEGLTTIGDRSFYNCTNLTKLSLPSTMTTFGNNILTGCMKFKKLEMYLMTSFYPGQLFPVGTYAQSYIHVTHDGVQYNLPPLFTNLIIKGSSRTSISANEFDNLATLSSIVVASNITAIGANAFENCSNLRFVILENSALIPDSTAFDGCTKLLPLIYGDSKANLYIEFLDENLSPFMLITLNGKSTGVLDRPIVSVLLSDDEFYNNLVLYLYPITKSAKAENFVDEQDAVVSALNQQLKIIKGELWYKMNFGLPLFDKIASKIQMDSAVIDIITNHKDVIVVNDFTSYISKGKYSCSMIVKTKYGDIPLSI